MADRGIIFSAPMVRALLDGRKTQTRRLCAWANNPASPALTYIVACDERGWFGDEEGEVQFRVPYAPGDRLYVREAWAHDAPDVETCRRAHEDVMQGSLSYGPYYRATDIAPDTLRWHPSIHMPRWASRLTLTVTDVRVQRLQEISEADAIAEGAEYGYGAGAKISQRRMFELLWNTLHTKPGERWEDNPWIVAVNFTAEQRNIDAGDA